MAFGSRGGTGMVAGSAPQSSSGAQLSGTEQDATSVYFLDVGQGDSELIRLKTGENILIDAGTPETAQELADYLADLGVSKIDCLVATHPHADHIGGMEQIVSRFEIGQIYMPRIPDSQIPTTAAYEKLLTAIDKKGLKITAPKAGTVIVHNGDEKLEILAPNSAKYDDLNSYSIVAMLTSGEKKFLFTGDAESDSEKEMVAKGYDLRCDVLKCGHHGSSTSTSAAFLKAANPKTAVISCGLNNDYGHPHKEVISRLQKAGVTIYRTDQQKTVLAQCDGKSIRFTTGLNSVGK
ncbi:MBL fold metallo-hydrolase [Caproiciproducens sp. AGMB10547]|uniref:MBL fold metallo-hydrolase n=2 Tax=Caproiciproducens faecalis TaxID=2820301 RepID=A0ABS7DP73_9FIRM|nr:MBL fold metallo-hydrolase [Caproiciproducens faecalis]